MSTKRNSKKDLPDDEALDEVNKHIKDAFDIAEVDKFPVLRALFIPCVTNEFAIDQLCVVVVSMFHVVFIH